MSEIRQIPGVLAAALAMFLLAPYAHAQTTPLGPDVAGGRLDIVGEAPQGCILSPPTETAISNAALVAGPTAGQVRLTQFVDPQTAVPNAATIGLDFSVVCNAAHHLTVRTLQGGLVLASPAPAPGPGLRNSVPYQVSVAWAGQQAMGSSDTMVPVDIATANGAAGVLSITIAVPGGGDPLVAGTYSDSLVVELLPTN
jgi:hypothetical protein